MEEIFGCSFCDYKTKNEDYITYCDRCDRTMCPDHVTSLEFQGWSESVCKSCCEPHEQSNLHSF